MKALITGFIILISYFGAVAQTYYSQGSGDPDLTSNWNTSRSGGGSTPSTFRGSNDVFVIQSGHTLTTTNNSGGNTNSGWQVIGTSSTLQIEDGGVLVADYEVDIYRSSGTFQIDEGGKYVHNNATSSIFDGTESFAANSVFEYQQMPSSTIENATYGSLILNYTTGGNVRFNAGTSGTITINGDFTIEQTSNSGADEVRCAAGSATGVTLDIAGDFIMTGGTFDFYSASGGSNGKIEVGGDFLLTGGVWDNDGTDNLEVEFTTNEASSSINLTGCDYSDAEPDLSFKIPTGKTLTMLSNWVIDETITIDGQLNFGTNYIEGTATNSAFVVSSGGTLGIGASDGIDNASTGGNIRFTLSKRSISTAANIIYNGTIAQETGDGLDDIGNLTGTLTIANTNATVAQTNGTEISFGDAFSFVVDENASFIIGSSENIKKAAGTTASLTINGEVQIEDDEGFSTSAVSGDAAFQGFTSCSYGSEGSVVYTQSGTQTLTNQFNYLNLTLQGSSDKDAAGNIDVNGDLIITESADLDLNSNQLNLAGSLTISSNGEITESGSTLVFDGTSTHTISCTGTPENFDDVEFTGTGTYNIASDLRINSGHTLSISAGCIINTGDNEFDSPSGTLVMSNGTFNFETITSTDNLPDFSTVTITGGTVELGGAGNQVLNGGETYNNLTFSGSGNKSISSATSDIDGTVYITESCTLNVGNSTFGDATTDLTMDNGYFIVEGSSTRPTIGGTYNLSGGTIEFAGTSSTSVRSPITYNNVVISGTDVSTSSGNYTLNDGATFTINAEAQFTTTNKRIVSNGTSNMIIKGTFKTEDSDGFIGTTGAESIDANTISLTLGPNSTVEYARGGAQPIADLDDYANLVISGSGTKSFTGTPSISRDYTISAGSVNYGTSITFSGDSIQNIQGDTYGTTEVVVDGGGEKNISDASSFNGKLTFTSGVLDLGNNDITINSSADISSANASSYFKIDGSGRLIQTISNGTNYEFPVGVDAYLPVTVSCASCSNEEVKIGVENVIYDDPEDETTTFATAGHTNYVNKTWDIETDGITGNVTIDIQWNATDQIPVQTSGNTSNNIAIGYWEHGSSTSWDPGIVSAASVSGTIFSQQRVLSGLNASLYYLGTGTSTTPLPVDLSYFKSTCFNNGLLNFEWETLSETNSSHFELQLSENGLDYFTVAEIMGQGTTLNPTLYQQTVGNSKKANFARLKQVDFDGSVDFSNTINIDCSGSNKTYVLTGNTISLDEPELVNVFSTNGKMVTRFENATTVDLNILGKGIYLVQIGNQIERVIVQ
ncbi:MAG: hypothetical protein ACPGLV_07425 [Bacteroidia bacterium]